MPLSKRILKSDKFATIAAFVMAIFIKLVRNTTRFEVKGSDIAARFWSGDEPFIAATWHGQNMLVPVFWHNWRELRVLVSRHGDGEIIARLMHFVGVGTIRGSGVPKGEEKKFKHKGKGGAGALRAMVRALGENISVGLTADLPPGPARHAGEGIIMLARLSGRPIVPIAITTRWRIQLNNWDRFTINLPFSRGAMVMGEPIYVPRDADDALIETLRLEVETALNTITEQADKLAGSPPFSSHAGAIAQ